MSTTPPEQPLASTETPPIPPPLDGLAPSSLQSEGTEPQTSPSAAALATGATLIAIPGYEILGELGGGGMGTIFKARDLELGRELAVKVLQERHRDDPRMVRRFLEEAQVGGQLQHPGVVPVHEAGRLPDDRPYFTMKLVEGRTLSDLLKEREGPAQDLPRFLKVFEQMCETVAYAHSRGVIHRDLKPTNVMVGAFGEVQVVDWGLAKVMRAGSVRPVRASRPEDESQAGAVMGTLAYMAREQACGDVDGLDARCDVFGLGAILCEILTGAPPYRGRDRMELHRQAVTADLTDAFARLDGCEADAGLVRLAKACLTADLAVRLADGGVVLGEITAYLDSVQERLRAAELEQARAEAEQKAGLEKAAAEWEQQQLLLSLAHERLRAAELEKGRAEAEQRAALQKAAAELRTAELAQARAEAVQRAAVDKAAAERKRRRLTVALAATLLLAVIGAGAAALEMAHDRVRTAEQEANLEKMKAEQRAKLEKALGEANMLGDQARKLKGDPVKWEAALAEGLSAVKRAEGLLISGEGANELQMRVAAQRQELEDADRDRRMIARLEDGLDRAGPALPYAAAFQLDDKDWDALEPEAAAKRINKRAIREVLLAALADWYSRVERPPWFDGPEQTGDPQRLQDILQKADPDQASFENRWRKARENQDWQGLRLLAFSPEAKDKPAAELAIMGMAMIDAGAAAEAATFLREANDLRPPDFCILFALAYALEKTQPAERDEAIRYYTAALALRPGSAMSHNNLGKALYERRQRDEAMSEYRKAIQCRPDYAPAHANLGAALCDKHDLEGAIAEFRIVVKLRPDDADAHKNLGLALRMKGELEEATAELKKAAELKKGPDD